MPPPKKPNIAARCRCRSAGVMAALAEAMEPERLRELGRWALIAAGPEDRQDEAGDPLWDAMREEAGFKRPPVDSSVEPSIGE